MVLTDGATEVGEFVALTSKSADLAWLEKALGLRTRELKWSCKGGPLLFEDLRGAVRASFGRRTNAFALTLRVTDCALLALFAAVKSSPPFSIAAIWTVS